MEFIVIEYPDKVFNLETLKINCRKLKRIYVGKWIQKSKNTHRRGRSQYITNPPRHVGKLATKMWGTIKYL
jgi:hypothetical protein